MSKKMKIDPITQAKQGLMFFNNLKDAVGALDKLVAFNIQECKKTLDRLEKAEQAELEKEIPADEQLPY